MQEFSNYFYNELREIEMSLVIINYSDSNYMIHIFSPVQRDESKDQNNICDFDWDH